jgi:hypothetical protein
MDERLGDVDGDGRDDLIRSHQETPPLAPHYDAVLQVVFADGRFSAPAVIGTPKLLADLDLDGDGRSEILVADMGNTAQAGGVFRLRDCALARVARENGENFIFTFWATGLGCAPACYPSVECQRSGAAIDLVATHAGWQPPTLGALPPPPSDDLLYWWQFERWRMRDGVMVRIESREGTARHADLPVPRRQGVHCQP